jgi:hypothetical protein
MMECFLPTRAATMSRENMPNPSYKATTTTVLVLNCICDCDHELGDTIERQKTLYLPQI